MNIRRYVWTFYLLAVVVPRAFVFADGEDEEASGSDSFFQAAGDFISGLVCAIPIVNLLCPPPGTQFVVPGKAITPPFTSSGLFGAAIALSEDGNTGIIGCERVGSTSSKFGNVYAFVKQGDTFVLEQELIPANPVTSRGGNNDYGSRVAISNNIALVSDLGATPATVYTFARGGGSGWTEGTAFAKSNTDRFGEGIGIDGDTAVVSDPESGAVYVYRLNRSSAWVEEATLTPAEAVADTEFGQYVAISGDTVIASKSSLADTNGAHVFTRTGTAWAESDFLPVPVNFFRSLTSFDLQGNTALIGAFDADTNAGGVYEFTFDGTSWDENPASPAMLANDLGEGALQTFGIPVSLSGNVAVVGQRLDSSGLDALAGAAYVFVRTGTTWTQTQKLFAAVTGLQSDRQFGADFASAIAISGNTVLVGSAYYDLEDSEDVGRLYYYDLTGYI